PLAPLAPWVGVYGIGAWGAFAAALVALALPRRPGPAGLGVALVVLPLALAGQSFSRPSGSLTVTLLQTNVSQDDKFAAEKMPAELDWVAARLEAARGELVMAPETAVPLLPDQLEQVDPGYWKALAARFSGPGQAALVGVPLGDYDHGYTNSVAGLSAGPRYRYDKHHLVPFGEFIPTGFRWFTELMDIPLGDFKRGVANPPSFPVRGERVAPNICYEDLFGEELARRFADPARAPTLFANVSNLGWFGDTEILAQHLNISRMRALEFERPMIRSTNTGATAIIDFRGRVTAELPVYARMTLDGSVQGRIGITPYAWWAARAGLWPLGLAALALIAAARRRSSQELYR
ncbi:MAG: apolipoprotein N-acyltransferase, partial [Burkholderiales bacterium]|nr:apolipoprotein N-acyltransferase [Burkholderiales bacterium]